MKRDSVRRESLSIIVQQPVQAATEAVKGLVMMSVDPGTGDLENWLGLRRGDSGIIYRFHDMSLDTLSAYMIRHETALIRFLLLGSSLLVARWASTLAGVRRARHRWDSYYSFLLLYFAYFPILSTGPHAMARFLVPILPAIAVFAAFGLADFVHAVRSRAGACWLDCNP